MSRKEETTKTGMHKEHFGHGDEARAAAGHKIQGLLLHYSSLALFVSSFFATTPLCLY